jgi:hypothetical protein
LAFLHENCAALANPYGPTIGGNHPVFEAFEVGKVPVGIFLGRLFVFLSQP